LLSGGDRPEEDLRQTATLQTLERVNDGIGGNSEMTPEKSTLYSKIVAGAALCLWLMSLPLVGFVDPGLHRWSGFDILSFGWLGLGSVDIRSNRQMPLGSLGLEFVYIQ
jgi:hypothetical protein